MCLRDRIAALIGGLSPVDAQEAADQQRALDWIASGAPLFRTRAPATPPMHLVSYFPVLDGAHILLVDHRKAGLWLPPGGHVDPKEHPADTVARECIEELGMPAQFLQPAPQFLTITRTRSEPGGHWDVSLWYTLQGDRHAVLNHDTGEFHGIRWFAVDQAPRDRVEPNLHRFLRKQGLIV